MNRDQINHTNMLVQVDIFFKERAELANENPIIADILLRLRTGLTDLDAYSQIQIKDTKGASLTKEQWREVVEADLITVGWALRAHASGIKNTNLMKMVDFSKSDIKLLVEKKLVEKAVEVADAALPLADSLVTYRVNADDLKKLQSDLEAYKKAVPAPRTIITVTKQSTTDIDLKLSGLMKMVREELDIQMAPVENYDATTYGIYKNAREIVDISATHPGKPDVAPPQDDLLLS